MLYGINPPTPLETINLMEEIFVKKEKLIEEKYVKFLEKVRGYYKDIEHGKIKEVKGSEIDELIKETKDYLEKIKKLFVQLEKKKETVFGHAAQAFYDGKRVDAVLKNERRFSGQDDLFILMPRTGSEDSFDVGAPLCR